MSGRDKKTKRDDPQTDEEWELASIRQRPSRLNPKPIGSVVKRLLAQRGYGETRSNQRLAEEWARAAGSDLAKLTKPANIVRGNLVVYAQNSAAMQELAFSQPQILKALQQGLPEMNIKGIRPRIG
ncbi:MAG: DUF721 domain-containing protein [Planctomycetota bacterium]